MSTQAIRSRENPNLELIAFHGHFATRHSHNSHYLDITRLKHEYSLAHDTALALANHYIYEKSIDTIICMDGSEVIGAFLARQLAQKILPPGAKTARLTQAQLADVRRLAAELYQSWDWTWGKTPAFTYEKTAEFAGRPIRVRYEARHGLIRNAAVQSDAIDAARASALLEGARLDPALLLDVCQALAGERAAELFDIFM